MSRSRDTMRNVTVEECEEMCRQYNEGTITSDIADEFPYTKKTVQNHVFGRCQHQYSSPESSGTECTFCGEPGVYYPTHLPCGEVPDID